MNVQEMRNYISQAYKGNWDEPLSRMGDDQIIAIYYRLIEKPNDIPPMSFFEIPQIKKKPDAQDTLF